jgi:hypothetical protein
VTGQRRALLADVQLPMPSGGQGMYRGTLHFTDHTPARLGTRYVGDYELLDGEDPGIHMTQPVKLEPGEALTLEQEVFEEPTAYAACFTFIVWDPAGHVAQTSACLPSLSPEDIRALAHDDGTLPVATDEDVAAEQVQEAAANSRARRDDPPFISCALDGNRPTPTPAWPTLLLCSFLVTTVLVRRISTAVLGAGIVACSGSDGADAGSMNDPDRRVIRTWMTTAEGGELRLDDGAILSVPPNALEADGEVTFTRRTCSGVFASDRFASCLFEVGSTAPLAHPFSIGLPQRESTRDASACHARQAASGWPCLAEQDTGSSLPLAKAGGFSSFAARVVVSPTDDTRVIDVPFVPCGGALEGEWELVGATGTADQVDSIVWIQRAPDPRSACGVGEHVEDRPYTISGRFVFSPIGQDAKDGRGSAIVSGGLESRRHTITTLACLDRVGESCDNSDFGNAREGHCVVRDGLCECDVRYIGEAFGGNPSWSYAGVGLVNLENQRLRYCVEGDRLSMEFTDIESGAPFLKLFRRSSM